MTEITKEQSFVMYDSFIQAAKGLDDATFKKCILKIRDYAIDGDDTPSDSPVINVILTLVKPNIDAARRRRDASRKNGSKGKEFGNLGGRRATSTDETPNEPLDNPYVTPSEPLNVDVDRNVDANVNNNSNVDVNVNADAYVNQDSNADENENRNVEYQPTPTISHVDRVATSDKEATTSNISSMSYGTTQSVDRKVEAYPQRKEVSDAPRVTTILDKYKSDLAKNLQVLFEYDANHLTFDDRSKAALREATNIQMALNNDGNFERAKAQIQRIRNQQRAKMGLAPAQYEYNSYPSEDQRDYDIPFFDDDEE